MSMYASEPGLDDIWSIDDYTLEPDEKEFVDIAKHVGHYEAIRIICPSGAYFSVEDAERIRDALTSAIEECRWGHERWGRGTGR